MSGPLRERLGEPFLRSLPSKPGVYLMLGADDALLYVGKAKNLRTRIRSYTRLSKDDDPRRISMIAKVRSIRWEEAEDDAAALARETELLRVLRPPFNHSHAARSKYLGIAVLDRGGKVRLRMTGDGPLPSEVSVFYGCFPFDAATPEAFTALVRMLSLVGVTAAPRRPSSGAAGVAGTDVAVDDEARALLRRFLAGRSPRLLAELEDRISVLDADVLVMRRASKDLATLDAFYVAGPRTVRRLQRAHGSDTQGVAGDELDRLLAAGLRSHFGVKLHEERAGVERLIADLKAEGHGFNAIAARLNRDGIPRVRGAGRWAAHEVAEVIGLHIEQDIAAASARMRHGTESAD